MKIEDPTFIHQMMRELDIYIPRLELCMWDLELIDEHHLQISVCTYNTHPTRNASAFTWHEHPILTITPGRRRGRYRFDWTILTASTYGKEEHWHKWCGMVDELIEKHGIQFVQHHLAIHQHFLPSHESSNPGETLWS